MIQRDVMKRKLWQGCMGHSQLLAALSLTILRKIAIPMEMNNLQTLQLPRFLLVQLAMFPLPEILLKLPNLHLKLRELLLLLLLPAIPVLWMLPSQTIIYEARSCKYQ
ncbi:hypothetical protein JG688_00016357, partial [Phytophthora aleatoria]